MRVSTVYACVRVLAEDVAKLPLILYRRRPGGGKERARDHPLYRVARSRANPRHTAFEFRETLQGHLGLRGNAYALVNRAGGVVRELIPIHPDRVAVHGDGSGPLSYVIRGSAREFTDREILHIRGLSTDGVYGLSPVSLARESIGLSVAMEQHGGRLFKNGAMPGGILRHPTVLSETAAQNLKDSVESAVSGENAHRLLLLEEGTEWVGAGLSNEDAQFLGSRAFQRTEICQFYRMPPHKVGILDKATFSNIEHQAIEYVVDCLMSWLERWTQRLDETLLTDEEREEYFFEFLVDALLRGTTKERYEANRMAILDGWKTRNEVRVMENLNPAEGLDEFLEPLNMARTNERAAA